MIVGSLLLCMHSTRRRRRVRHITPLHIEPPQSPVGHALPQETQEDLGLDIETCRREFPLFYPQLQENADAWRQLGGIRASDVNAAAKACEGGCAHIVIANRGQIFLRSLQQDWQSRVRAVLQLLQKALDSADPIEKAALDGTEFVFSTADKDGFKNKTGNGAGWVLDKRVTDLPGQYLIVSCNLQSCFQSRASALTAIPDPTVPSRTSPFQPGQKQASARTTNFARKQRRSIKKFLGERRRTRSFSVAIRPSRAAEQAYWPSCKNLTRRNGLTQSERV